MASREWTWTATLHDGLVAAFCLVALPPWEGSGSLVASPTGALAVALSVAALAPARLAMALPATLAQGLATFLALRRLAGGDPTPFAWAGAILAAGALAALAGRLAAIGPPGQEPAPASPAPDRRPAAPTVKTVDPSQARPRGP